MAINNNFGEVEELNTGDLLAINGGRLAYDIGFVLREAWIYYSNGGGLKGQAMVGADIIMNYRPK